MSKDTQTLHSLLQYHVLSDTIELARILINLGSSEARFKVAQLTTDGEGTLEEENEIAKQGASRQNDQLQPIFYEPAYQLGLDMLKKIHSNEDVVLALLNEGLIMRSLDYAVESEAKNLKLSLFLQFVERLKSEGLRGKADFVLRRVMDLKRADEIRRA